MKKIDCRECGHEFRGGEDILSYDDGRIEFYFCDDDCLKEFFMSFASYEVMEDEEDDEE